VQHVALDARGDRRPINRVELPLANMLSPAVRNTCGSRAAMRPYIS
jgi:hypothetical protein